MFYKVTDEWCASKIPHKFFVGQIIQDSDIYKLKEDFHEYLYNIFEDRNEYKIDYFKLNLFDVKEKIYHLSLNKKK